MTHFLCPIGEREHNRHAFRENGMIRRCEGYAEELGGIDERETGWTGR